MPFMIKQRKPSQTIRMVKILIVLTAVLLLLSSNWKPDDWLNLDRTKIIEVRVQTMEELHDSIQTNGKLSWHSISDQQSLSNFTAAFAELKKLHKEKDLLPMGEGVITLVTKDKGYYGIRYFQEEKKLLDLHTAYWYSYGEQFHEVLMELLKSPLQFRE